MSSPTADDVRVIVKTFVNRRLKELNRKPLSELPGDYDLVRSGILDSAHLVELMADVEEHFAREVDFAELDPEGMTIVEPLCTFISEQLAKS